MNRTSTETDHWRRAGARAVGLWETAVCGATYNPMSRHVIQNPYRAYAELRRRSPVHRSAILGSWVLTRYEDVVAAARDHERFSNNPRWRGATTSVLPPAPDDYSILLMDPPDHSRLRRVAARAFTRARLAALSETITRSAGELIERAVQRRKIDWITEVAAPLSMRVMLKMMGIAERDRPRWAVWVAQRARLLEMIAARQERRTAHRAGDEIQRYFTTLLSRRAKSDGDDAISTFAGQVDGGGEISMPEASDMLSVLMIAGNETTTNLIGNGMLALLRHPQQMQTLREEPGRMQGAINEMLRFDSPVQTDFRIAKAEVTVRGTHDQTRRWRDSAHRIGEPGRGGVRASRRLRHRAQGSEAHVIRRRRPLLHRRGTRPHGGTRDLRRGAAFDLRDQPRRRAALPAIDGDPGARGAAAASRVTCETRASTGFQTWLAVARPPLPPPAHPREQTPGRAAPNPAALRRTPARRLQGTVRARRDCCVPIRQGPVQWPLASATFDKRPPARGPRPILARFWWNPSLTKPNYDHLPDYNATKGRCAVAPPGRSP